MSANQEVTNSTPGAAVIDSRAEKAIRLLIATPGDPFAQKLEKFRAFYPAVATAKRNGMKHKQIIKIIADGGLKLYPALFEKLLAAMKRSRAVNMCPHCGQSVEEKTSEAVGESDQIEAVPADANGAATVEGA